jgi:predicted enzyme related to lactoylglutathione lyase
MRGSERANLVPFSRPPKEVDMIQKGNVTVHVSDMDRAIRFYCEALGLPLRVRYGNEWAEADTQGLTIGIHGGRSAGSPPSGERNLTIGLEVANLEEAMETLGGRGVTFAGRVSEDTAVRIAHFADPDGNPLYLCQVKYSPASH